MRFNYIGPFSGVTLLINGKPTEVLLPPGKPVELPETHDYVKTLLALGHLTRPHPSPLPAGEGEGVAAASEIPAKKGAK